MTSKAVVPGSTVMFALRSIPGFTQLQNLPCLHAPVFRKRPALLSWYLASVATLSQCCNSPRHRIDPEISLFCDISPLVAFGMLEQWTGKFSKVTLKFSEVTIVFIVNVLYPMFYCTKQNCAVFPLIADFFFFFQLYFIRVSAKLPPAWLWRGGQPTTDSSPSL